jgi:hypothetical protein
MPTARQGSKTEPRLHIEIISPNEMMPAATVLIKMFVAQVAQ